MSTTKQISPDPEAIMTQSPPAMLGNYSSLLTQHQLRYKPVGNYYQVGEITWVQGWILDVSVICTQIPFLLEVILPIMLSEDVPFRVIKNTELATFTLNGRNGLLDLGKVVSIYPKNDTQADILAEKINSLTRNFRGPVVLTDAKIGPVLYARYGACNPLIRMNELGNNDEYIFDATGQPMKYNLSIPFTPPSGIAWPFRHSPEDAQAIAPTMLKRKYKIMAVLKTDAKGDVMKALWMRNLFSYKWCVIKEARPNTNSDASGRDNRDRLHWQFKLHNILRDTIPLPDVYDLFEENGRTYMVLKFINGISLDERIQGIYNGKSWSQLSKTEKAQLFDYAFQLIAIIERLHKNAYIHRDITPVNFLVTSSNQMYAIDLELTYSLTTGLPDPPFLLGTAGFISPEQQAQAHPTAAQDIYSLGCTLITLLTGLLPDKFAASSKELVIKKIAWFIGEGQLANTIGHCLHSNPASRPSLETIKRSLQEFRQNPERVPAESVPPESEKNLGDIASVISQGILGLSLPEMLSQDKLWQSRLEQNAAFSYYQMEARTVYYGFGFGVAGVMLVLARAHQSGLDLGPTRNIFQNSVHYIQSRVEKREVLEHRGLYAGMAGVALAWIEAIESGLVDASLGKDMVQSLFEHGNVNGYGMAQGISGEGMVLLRAADVLDESLYLPKLNQQMEWLLSGQQSDGSWPLGKDEKGRLLQVTGFSQGMAGIISFLTIFYRRHPSETIRNVLVNALQWLTTNASRKDDKITWPVHTRTKDIDSGLSDGLIGIALCYVKAYETLRDPIYKKIAEDILWSIPHPLARRDITLEGGLTGIGELYLEAAEVFGDSQWKSRALSIVAFLLHQYCRVGSGAAFWLTADANFPTAGLLKGNAGILHFLMRYCYPKKLTHPLLSESKLSPQTIKR